jgi:hypothetical protein
MLRDMQSRNRKAIFNLINLTLVVALLSACQSSSYKDRTIQLDDGDAVHIMGAANNFDCDNPKFAKAEKIHTWAISYADGTVNLCVLGDPSLRDTSGLPSRVVMSGIKMPPRKFAIGTESNASKPH